jgi:exodeoxyribonuclease V gamma subunit
MFYLIQSNQMEILSAQLADMLRQGATGAQLLQNEQILVQSPGMSTWLRLEVARHNGIAAALEFPLPSSFTWQLCHSLLKDVPKENAFTKAAMTWKLMALLPSLLDGPDFGPLRHYLSPAVSAPHSEQQPGSDAALKLYQLCGRIADILDQYLVYRPDWILGWELGESPLPLSAEQAWQPILWRALIDFNANTLKQSHYHRANLHAALIGALNSPATDMSRLPRRLFVFGISSMAPQTLEVLAHLGRRIDVINLSLSPCQHYWGDIVDPRSRARMAVKYADKQQLPELWEDKLEVGNPLLANNGKMGRELLDLMLELPTENTDLGYDCYLDPIDDRASLTESPMLHGVQHDILEMQTLGRSLGPDVSLYQDVQARRPLLDQDDSISLRRCHSPLREIETLHDHLLAKLEANPELYPKDIVVMMPDVAAYAPYIDAVFAAKQGAHFIPYAIADRGAAQESPLINSFLHLLGIHQSRFCLTDIVSILEVPAVLRRFSLDTDELQLIKRWLDEAGVRWGRDEQSRIRQGLAAFDQNSWAFGIKRLILGYALSDDAPLYLGHLKVEGIEGQSAQALGKLLNFIEVMDQYLAQLSQDANSEARLSQLQALLQDFYQTDDDERIQLQEIQDAIGCLKTELEQAGFGGAISIEVLQSWFASRLTESRVGQRYLAGSVNFCTLMPMRSIPFKLVCLLGMNDGVYPRTQHPVGFDLMAHTPARRGDRSRRLDDRYLFLEALLSARDQLYISYIGASERDNSERIPSMLVSELIEYCQLCYVPQALCTQSAQGLRPRANCTPEEAEAALLDRLIVSLPLQPFDASLYLSADEGNAREPRQPRAIKSYNAQWCPPIKDPARAPRFMQPDTLILNQADDEAVPHETAHQEVDLSALIRFFRNPAQYFFNRSLKVELRLDTQAEDNDEPFSLNALERYQLQSQLLDSAIDSGEEYVSPELCSLLKASGTLPMAPFDDLLLTQYQRDIAPLIGRVLYLKGESEDGRHLDIDLDIDLLLPIEGPQGHLEVRLVGRIEDLSPRGLVNYRPGAAHGRDILRLYLRHLCINAMGRSGVSYLLDIGHFHALHPLTQGSARAQLCQLLAAFYQGQQRPLCFMPRTSLAYVQAEGEHPQRLLEAQTFWLDEQGQLGEGTDPHYQRLFSFPRDFTEADFGKLACQLLEPMVSLYHKDVLGELADFVQTTWVQTTGVQTTVGLDTQAQSTSTANGRSETL